MTNAFKQLLCIVLVSAFMLQTFSKVIILINFKVNREYISKNFCENRNKPQMHCDGKCHLKKQLEKEEKKEQSPANPGKEKNEIQLFSENKLSSPLFHHIVTSELMTYYSFHLSEKHLYSVFHPPRV